MPDMTGTGMLPRKGSKKREERIAPWITNPVNRVSITSEKISLVTPTGAATTAATGASSGSAVSLSLSQSPSTSPSFSLSSTPPSSRLKLVIVSELEVEDKDADNSSFVPPISIPAATVAAGIPVADFTLAMDRTWFKDCTVAPHTQGRPRKERANTMMDSTRRS